MKTWKKKAAAFLLVLCLVLGLCACGGGDTPVENTPAENTPPVSSTQEPVTEPEVEPEPELEPEPEPEAPAELEGIIVLSAYASGEYCLELNCIDPATGEMQPVNTFYVDSFLEEDEDYCFWFADGIYASHRDIFNDDYSKIAVTKIDRNRQDIHAGWLDSNGEFFDVTEALGQQRTSEFDDPIDYEAIGFSEDGYFVYGLREGRDLYMSYFAVPVDNVAPDAIEPGLHYRNDKDAAKGMHRFWGKNVTSWLNDHTYIRNGDCKYNCKSYMVDIDDGTSIDYVPGSESYCWSAVANADGTQVALIIQLGTHGPIDLYTMSLDGSDPVKVPNDLQWSQKQESEAIRSMALETRNSMPIDWK